MRLPVNPPVAPMLAKPVETIPDGPYCFEPKWDGFRSIVFRDRGEVEIGSRNERPMTRYFPEIVAAILANLPERCVIDGEIVVPDAEGRRLDFDALLQRIHPAASRVDLLAEQTPAHFVAFDLLALGDADLTEQPFAQRRAALEGALAGARSPIHLTPVTSDRDQATGWFRQFEGAGLDGLIAKPLGVTYQPDKRAMLKIKHERTADCVVAGYRTHKDGKGVGSLLLGLYDDEGDLHHVGVASSFAAPLRTTLADEVAPYRTDALRDHPWREWGGAEGEATRMPGAASRWNAGKDLSWEALRIELVAEVAYEHLQRDRFRHTARFVRWRPDREPASCTYAQLDTPVPVELRDVFGV
jgi:ATP-dependent DNA ligase